MAEKLKPGIHTVNVRGKQRTVRVKENGMWQFLKKGARSAAESVKPQRATASRTAPHMAKRTNLNIDKSLRLVAGLSGLGVLLEPVAREVFYPGAPVGNFSPTYYRPPTSMGEGFGRALSGFKNSAKAGQMVAAAVPSVTAEVVIAGKRMVKRIGA